MDEIKFYNWITNCGLSDIIMISEALNNAELKWCITGGFSVNFYDGEDCLITNDIDILIKPVDPCKLIELLEKYQFTFNDRIINKIYVRRYSDVIFQIDINPLYEKYIDRSIVKLLYGYNANVTCLEDTLMYCIDLFNNWSFRQSNKFRYLSNISRLVETNREAWNLLPDNFKSIIKIL